MSLPPLVEPAAELTDRRGTPLQPPPDHPRRRDGRSEAAEERQGARHRRRRPRLAGAALPGRGRRRHARHRRVRRGRRVQPAAPDHPRPERHRPPEGRVRPRTRSSETNPLVNVVVHNERLDNDNVLEIFEQYDLIVDGTDNFATRYMVNDAAVLLKQALRLGLDLPLRRPGVGLLGRARARATAASTPSPRRRAWCRRAPRAACSACSAPASARSRSTRRSSSSPASASRCSAS